MYEKCNYFTKEACDAARESGAFSWVETINEPLKAIFHGHGDTVIDYCPHCGERITPKIIMISGKPYGKSPIMEMIEKGFFNAPIIPVSAGEIEVDYKPIRDFTFDSYLADYKYSMDMAKFQEHVNNLKSERDKLPEYAQESLDAILNGYVCGIDMASGPDVSVIDGVVQE